MMTINKHKHSISSGFFVCVCSVSVNQFLRLGNTAWDFLGVNFWSRDFLGFVGSPRDFFGF